MRVQMENTEKTYSKEILDKLIESIKNEKHLSVVSKVLLNGSYYLVDIRELKDRPDYSKKRKTDDRDNEFAESKRPWNIAQLRHFYT